MKSLFIFSLTLLFIPVASHGTWNDTVNYNLNSGEIYHNKELHLHQNRPIDSLVLTGNSLLTINGNSLLNNAVVNNNASIHMYNISSESSVPPVIRNTQFNDYSTLTMETDSVSSGKLFIGKEARLNIMHVDTDSYNTFLNSPEISGNVYIENLNLAGRVCIKPTSTLVNEHNDSDYQQPPGTTVVTRIDNLTMQLGSLLSMQEYIPYLQFNQLQINTLSGRGHFILSSHLAGGMSDKIVVSGHASGHFGLAMSDSGYEPTTTQRVDLISVNSGDAHFDLLNNNGIVEAGVWQYTLQHEKNGEHSHWYLSNQQVQSAVAHDDSPPESLTVTVTPTSLLSPTETPNVAHQETPSESLTASPTPLLPPTEPQSETDISPPVNQSQRRNVKPILSHSAQAVINMASASRKILATEMSTFRQRLGAVRSHKKNISIWTRYLKDDSHHASHSGSSFKTHLQGLQIGIDKRTEFNAGDWLLGTYISDSKTTVQSGELPHGKIRSQSGGLYATWLDNSGFYWDNVFKLNQLRHEIHTEMNSGQLTRGHYRQNGISAASEAGYSLHLNRMLTLTPYGKVSYFRTRQVNSVLDNGLATTIPLATNIDGEAGLMLEVPFSLDQSRLRPYLKAAVSRELVGNNTLAINGINLDIPRSGAQGKYGLGSTLQIASDLSAWAEMDYQKGKRTETPVSATLGVRVSF